MAKGVAPVPSLFASARSFWVAVVLVANATFEPSALTQAFGSTDAPGQKYETQSVRPYAERAFERRADEVPDEHVGSEDRGVEVSRVWTGDRRGRSSRQGHLKDRVGG